MRGATNPNTIKTIEKIINPSHPSALPSIAPDTAELFFWFKSIVYWLPS